MKLSVVLSTHAAAFQSVAFKGDFEANVAKIASWGYDGVELAVRDPAMVNAGQLERVVAEHNLVVPAIGTGQAWGEEGLSFTSDDPAVRAAAIKRISSHIPLAAHLDAIVILGLIRGMTPEG
ncbi:MAG: TIM barrel protein, partial [Acidobacteriota bacterium]|nr:TIM barrel protein [Acidobacteriota bacterium]